MMPFTIIPIEFEHGGKSPPKSGACFLLLQQMMLF
jgi:hypothetical protein